MKIPHRWNLYLSDMFPPEKKKEKDSGGGGDDGDVMWCVGESYLQLLALKILIRIWLYGCPHT